MDTTLTAVVEALRTYYVCSASPSRAHVCTAALNGEQWAIARIADLIGGLDAKRPDGAVARGGFAP